MANLKQIWNQLKPLRKLLSRRFRVLKVSPNWNPERSHTRILYSVFQDDPSYPMFWKPTKKQLDEIRAGDVVVGTFALYYYPETDRHELRHGRDVVSGRIELRSTEGEQHSDRLMFVPWATATEPVDLGPALRDPKTGEIETLHPVTFAGIRARN